MAVSASAGNESGVEFRAGLVLYGGVSLAVYMGGVATEFLDAVRAAGEGSENPYQPLLKALNGRFIVDVIAGASAGGINGVFLSRALATNGRIDHLAELWQKYGDFSVLTNWQGEEPESVLNGRRFLEELKKAMGQVGDSGGESLVPILDLFVTATDMQGKYWARSDDLDHLILGRNHGRLIHLKYRSKHTLVDEDDDLGYVQNDFKEFKTARRGGGRAEKLSWSETGDFLATVCRTTAAFPGAFEPVDFKEDQRQPAELPDGRTSAWMTDGGVLQNRPFAPVLRKIFRRAARGRVERALFYVEPVLEDAYVLSDHERSRKPNAFGVIRSSLELPMYQGIAQHLQELEEHNKIVRNLHQVMEALEPRAAAADQASLPADTPARRAYLALRAGQWCKELRERYHESILAAMEADVGGETYGRIQRLLLTTEERLEQFDAQVAAPATADPGPFLDRCDLAYQMRRLEYLIERCARLYLRPVDPNAPPDPARTERQRTWEKRVFGQEAVLWRALDRLRDAEKRCWADPPESPSGIVDRLAEALYRWQEAEEHGIRQALKALTTLAPERPGGRADAVDFVHIYDHFGVRDQLLFPLGVGSRLGERDLISWVRVSPYDASTIFQPEQGAGEPTYEERLTLGRRKIAGDSLMNFGGFLSWRWRANDFMWGRLDAVDTIVSTLLTQARRSGHYTPDELEEIEQAALRARERGFKRAIQANLHPIGQQELARFVEQRLTVERTLQARIARAHYLISSLQTSAERRQVASVVEAEVLSRRGPRPAEDQEGGRLDQAPDPRSAARELSRLLPQVGRELAGLDRPGSAGAGIESMETVLRRVEATGQVTEDQGRLLEQVSDSLSRVAAGTMAVPFEVEGALLRGERLTYAPWMVEILDWAGLHTFLIQHYNTGAEDLKNLHPGVTAHVGIDVAENLRRVAAGVMERSSRPVTPLAHKLGQVIGYPIQWASKVIRPLIPRPGVGEDDRVPPLWKLVAQLVPMLVVAAGYIGTKFGMTATAVLIGAILLLGVIPLAAWKLRGKADLQDLPAPPAAFWGWGLMMILVVYGANWLDWNLPGTAVTPLELVRVLGWGMLTAYVVMSLTLLLTRGFQPGSASRSRAARGAASLLRWAVGLLLVLPVVLAGAFLLHSHVRGTGLPAPVAVRVEAEQIRVPGVEGAGYPPEGVALAADGSYLVTTLDGYVLRRNDEQAGGWDPPMGQRLTAALGIQTHGRDGYLLTGIEAGKGGGLYRWVSAGGSSGSGSAGTWERLIEIPGSPNGLAVYGQHAYVSTEPAGWKIWHVRLDGGPVRREALKGSLLGSLWAAPNGLAIREVRGVGGQVERVSLLVGEMVSGRLWEVPLTLDGEIDPAGQARNLAQFPGFVDGVLALRDGRIAVSTNEGFLYIYHPRLGKVTHTLKIPERRRAAAGMVEDDGRIAFAAIGQFELLGKPLFGRSFPGDELGWVRIPKAE